MCFFPAGKNTDLGRRGQGRPEVANDRLGTLRVAVQSQRLNLPSYTREKEINKNRMEVALFLFSSLFSEFVGKR